MKQLMFHSPIILNVDYLDVEPPAGASETAEIGYFCGGFISIFSDGSITTIGDDGLTSEKIHISDLLRLKTNTNNHDPFHEGEVSYLTDTREINVSFRTPDMKEKCVEVLASLLSAVDNCPLKKQADDSGK